MNNKIEDRIKNVMSAVFEIYAVKITEESSSSTIETWDSLKHINLVVALEEEFDIQFNDSEIIELQNMLIIKNIIEKKI